MGFSVKVEPKTLHFAFPAGTSRGIYTERNIHIIRITHSDFPQREGVGECAPLPSLSCDLTDNFNEILRNSCRSLEATGCIDREALRYYPSILFAMETAMLHFEAGSLQLFPSPFSRGEIGIPINGLVWMGNYEEMLSRLQTKIKDGYGCIKIKIGAINFSDELSLLSSIRSRFSEDYVELRVDANGAFSPTDAMKKLEALSAYKLHSIEQPIRAGQWEAMERLCNLSPIPIALDEELIGVNNPNDKARLLNTIKPHYIILKPTLHGGLYGCEEWINLCSERAIPFWITSAMESNIGLNAIAQWTYHIHSGNITRPQGLGTGGLFTDNFPSPLKIVGNKLFFIDDTRRI